MPSMPKNTKNKIYIAATYEEFTIDLLLEHAKNYWGQNISWDDLTISLDYIKTSGCGCHHGDSFDYTNFIVLNKKGE